MREGHYRARDLLLLPSLLSLARLPLAVCFPFAVRVPSAALAVLALAGVSDVLDGWVARRRGLATATGAAVDGVADKVFALVVVVTLLSTGHLGVLSVLLLSARELGEAPLLLWFLVSPSARARRVAHPRANVFGKMATVLQFISVGFALFGVGEMGALGGIGVPTLATGVAGTLAALSYWRRELGAAPAALTAR